VLTVVVLQFPSGDLGDFAFVLRPLSGIEVVKVTVGAAIDLAVKLFASAGITQIANAFRD
jgi:hypothetical protein